MAKSCEYTDSLVSCAKNLEPGLGHSNPKGLDLGTDLGRLGSGVLFASGLLWEEKPEKPEKPDKPEDPNPPAPRAKDEAPKPTKSKPTRAVGSSRRPFRAAFYRLSHGSLFGRPLFQPRCWTGRPMYATANAKFMIRGCREEVTGHGIWQWLPLSQTLS